MTRTKKQEIQTRYRRTENTMIFCLPFSTAIVPAPAAGSKRFQHTTVLRPLSSMFCPPPFALALVPYLGHICMPRLRSYRAHEIGVRNSGSRTELGGRKVKTRTENGTKDGSPKGGTECTTQQRGNEQR